jgi:hypothetical protein
MKQKLQSDSGRFYIARWFGTPKTDSFPYLPLQPPAAGVSMKAAGGNLLIIPVPGRNPNLHLTCGMELTKTICSAQRAAM